MMRCNEPIPIKSCIAVQCQENEVVARMVRNRAGRMIVVFLVEATNPLRKRGREPIIQARVVLHKFAATTQEPRSGPRSIYIGVEIGKGLNKGCIVLSTCVPNQRYCPTLVILRLAHDCSSFPRARRYSSTTTGSETC